MQKPLCKIAVPTLDEIRCIDVKEIIRVQALSNYSKIYLANGHSIVVAKVLRWFEERLVVAGQPGVAATVFLRTHRTHLINTGFIAGYRNGKIQLVNQEHIEVAKRRKQAVKNLFAACF
jgi:DNA-binding LytR/AlgR family response regulator